MPSIYDPTTRKTYFYPEGSEQLMRKKQELIAANVLRTSQAANDGEMETETNLEMELGDWVFTILFLAIVGAAFILAGLSDGVAGVAK